MSAADPEHIAFAITELRHVGKADQPLARGISLQPERQIFDRPPPHRGGVRYAIWAQTQYFG
jgi:hypothetical protein